MQRNIGQRYEAPPDKKSEGTTEQHRHARASESVPNSMQSLKENATAVEKVMHKNGIWLTAPLAVRPLTAFPA